MQILRCESEASVRDFLHSPTVEDLKTKLACETSFKFQQLKNWKRSIRARLPSDSISWTCEKEAFVRDFLQIPTVEDVKTMLSCGTSIKIWKLKIWKRSFRVRSPSNPNSWRCENEAFELELLQMPTVQDVKAKLACQTSFKVQHFKIWNRSSRARLPSKSKSWRSENEALCFDTPLLWQPCALTPICLWHPLAATSFGFDIRCLWHPLPLTSFGLDISWLWHLLASTLLDFDIPLCCDI